MRKKLIVYRIGNDDRPANGDDIRAFKRLLKEALKEKADLICHHAVSSMVIEYDPEKQRVIWKIGSDENPAAQVDIDWFSRKLDKAYRKQKRHGHPYATLVVHHEAEVEIVDLI